MCLLVFILVALRYSLYATMVSIALRYKVNILNNIFDEFDCIDLNKSDERGSYMNLSEFFYAYHTMHKF